MCTAQNLLQRFFYRKPLTKFDAFSVAMGCMLLAMKIEEDPRQPRAVVLVFHRMFERRMGVEPSSVIPPESLRALRDEMLRVELHVLKELGFGFYNIMDHPHKFILYYLRVLDLDIEGDVSQRAWNYVNDSLRTDLSLRFRSEVVACAAIYMASRSLGIKLPDNPPWWVLFNADMQEMGKICNTILALYHRPKVAFLEPLCERSVFTKGGPLRREAVVEGIPEVHVPADAMVEPASSLSEPAAPSAQDSIESSTAAAVSTVSVRVYHSPEAPVPSAPGAGSDVNGPESNGTVDSSSKKDPERASESRSRSPGSRSAQSSRSHSTSLSAPGMDREDEGADREANGRAPERAQDRERDRKRSRESRRSRSRSRSRSRRERRGDSREKGRDRTRERERERGRGRDWGRGRDREKERGGDRRHDGRRSRR